MWFRDLFLSFRPELPRPVGHHRVPDQLLLLLHRADHRRDVSFTVDEIIFDHILTNSKRPAAIMLSLRTSIQHFVFTSACVSFPRILQPMSMHQFGWEDEDAVTYVGIFVACQGLLASFVFAWIGPLSKRIDERWDMLNVHAC